MAPARDIRDFFRPGLKSHVSASSQESPAAHASVSGSQTRHVASSQPHIGHSNSPLGRPSPAPAPAASNPTSKRPLADAEQTTRNSTSNRAPSTSQSSSNSSGSKRVISGGEPVVLDSESDTDSDVELQDIDFGLKKSPPRKVISRDLRKGGNSQNGPATRSVTYLQMQDDGLRKPPKKYTPSRSGLNRLVQAAQKDALIEQKIAERKRDLDQPVVEPPAPPLHFNEESLAQVVQDVDDGEETKRLYLAMQRTNPLNMSCVFHLFHEKANVSPHQELAFPIDSLPSHGWAANFEDPWRRNQAFLSGSAELIFRYQSLPKELALWMMDQICTGRSEALNAKYIQILEAHPEYLGTIVDQQKLDKIFIDLGIDMQCLNPLQEVVPSHEPNEAVKRPLPLSLPWVLRLLRSAAHCLPPTSNSHAFFMLLHLCFDDSVMSNPAVLYEVQDALESVMCSITDLTPVFNDIVPLLLSRITNPILQNNLVLSLPVKSPLAACFRRHMALSFFLLPTPLNIPLSSPELALLLHSHLDQSPHFSITRHTDHITLAARIALLDIGIGPGPTTMPYPRPIEPCSSDEEDVPRRQATLTSEERAFNKQIDVLTQHIKLLSNKIIEAGAISDLSRLDAKDCCEKLYHRLNNAVRIGGRKREGIINDDEEPTRQRRFLDRFLKGKPESGPATPVPATTGDMDFGDSKDNKSGDLTS